MDNRYFTIAYIDSDRTQIHLVELGEYESTYELDLASRRKFSWWNGDYRDTEGEIEDNSDLLRADAKASAEADAAAYARELAAQHNLTFIGKSNTDGILD